LLIKWHWFVAGERRLKLSFLGTRHRSSFDDRQSLDIHLVVIFYLATPRSKTPLGRILLIKDEEAEIKIQVSVRYLAS
jgi:hypothetical protein